VDTGAEAVEDDNTVVITVAISCFVVFGVLVFLLYCRINKKKKKNATKENKEQSESTSQPLMFEKLNFDLFKE